MSDVVHGFINKRRRCASQVEMTPAPFPDKYLCKIDFFSSGRGVLVPVQLASRKNLNHFVLDAIYYDQTSSCRNVLVDVCSLFGILGYDGG